MTTESIAGQSEQSADSGHLLSPEERIECQWLTDGEGPDNQRAQALLALDDGATQEVAGQSAGLTKGQMRYWLGKFRKSRMAIFPKATLTLVEPQPGPEEPPSDPAATAEEGIVDPAIAVKEVQPEADISDASAVAVSKAARKKETSQRKSKKGKKPKKGKKGKRIKEKYSQKGKGGKKKKAKKATGVKKSKKKKASKKQSGKKTRKKDK